MKHALVSGASCGTVLFALFPIAGITIKKVYCELVIKDEFYVCSELEKKPPLLSTICLITLFSAVGMAVGSQYNHPATGIAIGSLMGTVTAMHFKIETILP